jgi:hypothetical protein
MIRAMLWKEWREQRTVAATVLGFGAAALYLTAQFAEPMAGGNPWEGGGPRELMALALAYLAGAVSGAILLADEKEVGTLEFLDTLPCRRQTIWVGKAVAGGLLAVGQCVAIAAFAMAFGSIDDRLGRPVYGLVVLLVGVLAYAWGVFGGALARSTLGAVFQGSLASFAAGFVLLIPFVFVFGPRAVARPFGTPLIAYFGCWVAVGLAGSAVLFTGVDRQRTAARRRPGSHHVPAKKPWLAGLRALSWLTARQAIFVTAGVGAAALIAGGVMLAPDAHPLFIWPGATLALGVLAGVTTVGEEQVRGVGRFWAERRLPLGRLWAVKTGAHFALAMGAALVIGVFVYAASPHLPFHSRLTHELWPEFGRFLALGLVYGFVVGHLAGMVFRKTVVAGLVAMVVAVTLVGLILPSVISGGAAAWQVWGPAAVLLVLARLLLYPWATERVATRGPVLRAVGGVVASLAVLGAGISYRAAGIPTAADRLAESGYVESLPIFEANDVGHAVRSAATQYRTAAADARDLYPGRRPPGGDGRRPVTVPDLEDPVVRVLRNGWTSDAGQLNRWLDRVFAANWLQQLEDVADRPPGVYEDPRDLDYFTPPDSFQNLREMTIALRVRAAQRQAAGEPDALPRLLKAGLAATRTTRNRGGLYAADVALDSEYVLLSGLPEWLDRLDGRPDLLRQTLTVLDRHEAEMPVGTTDTFWAEQVILRNTMDRVGSWLPKVLDPRPDRLQGPDDRVDAEANLVAFAWHVPWEQVRRERLLRLETNRPVDPRWLSGVHRPNHWRLAFERTDSLAEVERKAMTVRRFARLRVALRLYGVEHATPAPDLATLVPTYLPAVPLDPYTGRPFGYRLSAGETIAAGTLLVAWEEAVALGAAASVAHPVGGLNGLWLLDRVEDSGPARRSGLRNPPVAVTQWVPPGYGIVWSAGPDGRDDGSRQTGPRGIPGNSGADWIVLIRPGRRPE